MGALSEQAPDTLADHLPTGTIRVSDLFPTGLTALRFSIEMCIPEGWLAESAISYMEQ